MIGVKKIIILFSVLLVAVNAGKRNSHCDAVCQGKMTIECCECIGCHQGMRFGKRGFPSTENYDDSKGRDSPYLNGVEDAISTLETEFDIRPRRFRYPAARITA